jgi:hypothetical protein
LRIIRKRGIVAERKRLLLLGSDRAEYEHVHGPLVEDKVDPRFVLVTAEEEERILSFPKGIPARHFQDAESKARIASEFKDAAEAADAVRDGDSFDIAGVVPNPDAKPEVRVNESNEQSEGEKKAAGGAQPAARKRASRGSAGSGS